MTDFLRFVYYLRLRFLASLLLPFVLAIMVVSEASAYEERWGPQQYTTQKHDTPEESCDYIRSYFTANQPANAPYSVADITDTNFRIKVCHIINKNGSPTLVNIYRQYRCENGIGSWQTPDPSNPPDCYEPPEEPESCEPGADQYTGMDVVVTGDVRTTCIDGCAYPLHFVVSYFLNPDGWISAGTVGNNSGDSCTPADFPAPNQEETPEDKCAKEGKSFGLVNGTVVCVEPGTPGSAPVKQSSESSSETVISVTNEGDTITTTTNTSTSTTITTNSGGGVTATTTTTTQNPDGSSTVTTSTQDMPMSDFCALNPHHSLCKSEPKTDCDKYPDSLACQILGEAPELTEADGLQTIEREIGSIVLPSLPQSSGCPAPLTYSIAGRPITVSFQPVCEYAEAFHPLVVAAAWLSAAFIVVGARKDL